MSIFFSKKNKPLQQILNMENTVKLHVFQYNELKTYLMAALFVVGNIILPQVCHLVPNGGLTLLPIYFFTLIAAYKYGITVGLLTALCSPLVNNLLFGMPPAPMLPVLLVKSVLLALAASGMAKYSGKISLPALLGVVLVYQVTGTLFEWFWMGDFRIAIQDFRVGIPGLLIQIFGGYAVLRGLAKS